MRVSGFVANVLDLFCESVLLLQLLVSLKVLLTAACVITQIASLVLMSWCAAAPPPASLPLIAALMCLLLRTALVS